MPIKSLQAQIRRKIETSILIDGWKWGDPDHAFFIAVIKKKYGNRHHRIEIQRDKWWTKNGGTICVNYAVLDDGLNSFYGFNYSADVVHARLAMLAGWGDAWIQVNPGNIDDAVGQVANLIDNEGVKLFKEIEENGNILKLPDAVMIRPGYPYAFYIGDIENGKRMIVDAMMRRDKSDILCTVLKKIYNIDLDTWNKIQLIQIQAAQDQKNEMSQLVKSMGLA